MGIYVRDLLKDNVFSGAVFLSGKDGINRVCKRLSVFDCPCHKELLDDGIIEPGDLFISCLEQFKNNSAGLWDFVHVLVEYQSVGLLIPFTGAKELLTDEILLYLDEMHFPVIQLQPKVSYGQIMSAANALFYYEDRNDLNRRKLDDILHGNLSDQEKTKLLLSLNPFFGPFIRAIFVKGEFHSPWFSKKLVRDYSRCREDTILEGDYTIFLLSGKDQKWLKNHSNVIANQLNDYFYSYHVGYSRIRPLHEILDVIREGKLAVRVSNALQVSQQAYDPLLTLHLMFTLQNSIEARDFYRTYKEAISSGISENNLDDWLRTVELFVALKGDYAAVAEQLNQHVNTIRYRINRIKQLLNMENDTIRFYETISIATKLRICFESEI